MSTATSYVVDFRDRDAAGAPIPGPPLDPIPYYRVIVCPQDLEIDTAFRVTLLAPFGTTVEWPYGSISGPDNGAKETFVERINLGGRTEIELDYPISELTGVEAVNSLVNEALTITHDPTDDVLDAHQVLGRLRFRAARWGTVDVTYKSHAPAWYDIPGQAYPEEYVLSLDSPLFREPERVTITITDPGAPAAGDGCTGHTWSL